jgi:transcriptional regulator with XRE-family HTH domain
LAEWRNEGLKRFWIGVGARLKLTRHLLNISEQEAADALLVTLRTYRKWECGELHQQNHYGIFNFCETYGVACEWLFGGIKHGDPPRFRLRLVS